jgi:site-specific DNA-methyltransferase (adenine-specific)
MQASEIRFVQGRLKFGGGQTNDPAPFPSAVVVFKGGHNGQQSMYGPVVSGVKL